MSYGHSGTKYCDACYCNELDEAIAERDALRAEVAALREKVRIYRDAANSWEEGCREVSAERNEALSSLAVASNARCAAEQDAARLAALLVDVRSYVLKWHKTREHMDADIRRALAEHEARIGGGK